MIAPSGRNMASSMYPHVRGPRPQRKSDCKTFCTQLCKYKAQGLRTRHWWQQTWAQILDLPLLVVTTYFLGLFVVSTKFNEIIHGKSLAVSAPSKCSKSVSFYQ